MSFNQAYEIFTLLRFIVTSPCSRFGDRNGKECLFYNTVEPQNGQQKRFQDVFSCTEKRNSFIFLGKQHFCSLPIPRQLSQIYTNDPKRRHRATQTPAPTSHHQHVFSLFLFTSAKLSCKQSIW